MDWPDFMQDTAAVVKRNWRLLTMGANWVADDEKVDHSPDNVPQYWRRNDQRDNPKGHFTRKRSWF